MFFILSKVLFFLIQPLNWVVGLLIYSVFSKKPKWKKRSRNLALIFLVFFTNGFILNLVMRAWETDIQPFSSLSQSYDIGIVLGGYSNFHIQPDERYNFSQGANRLTQALELYKEGKIKKILLTGGSGSFMKDFPSEANEVRPFLLKMGVSENDLIIEPNSRNTHENAVFTKQILEKYFPDSNCLLITSAYHMRRSKGCFKKENIRFTAFSTDILGEEFRLSPANLILPNSMGFSRWELLIKEWIGYAVYWFSGYI
jgi:uncharacterized SAM-binding protein YcdF (DUF218 family)